MSHVLLSNKIKIYRGRSDRLSVSIETVFLHATWCIKSPEILVNLDETKQDAVKIFEISMDKRGE